MDIWDNPLHISRLTEYVTEAVANNPGNREEAYQRTLHAGLRSCSWGSPDTWQAKLDCMEDIFARYKDVDLDKTFGRGSLLCYAGSPPILSQGTKALAPLALLLERGADPHKVHNYHLLLEFYRQGRQAFHGSFIGYIHHLERIVRTDADLLKTIDHRPEPVLESIDYVKGLLGDRYTAPSPSLGNASYGPATKSGAPYDVMGAALCEIIDSRQPSYPSAYQGPPGKDYQRKLN